MPTSRHLPPVAIAALAVLGVLLVVVGAIYLGETAGNLPSFFPGHSAGSAHRHSKHGLAAIILAVVCFAGAWLGSGRKRATA